MYDPLERQYFAWAESYCMLRLKKNIQAKLTWSVHSRELFGQMGGIRGHVETTEWMGYLVRDVARLRNAM